MPSTTSKELQTTLLKQTTTMTALVISSMTFFTCACTLNGEIVMKLIIDSCSDLSLSKAQELGADVLPLTIQIEDKSYLDQFEITSEEVIQAIKDGKRPMTSQPNPDAFEKLFKKYTDQGE